MYLGVFINCYSRFTVTTHYKLIQYVLKLSEREVKETEEMILDTICTVKQIIIIY